MSRELLQQALYALMNRKNSNGDTFAEAAIEALRAELAKPEPRFTDAERLEYLHSNLDWDGYGYWLPEICVKEKDGSFTDEPTLEEFRQFLDERRVRGEAKP